MLDVNRSSLLLWPVKEDMISAEKSSNRWEACAAAKRPDGEGTRVRAVWLRSGGQQWSAVPDGGYVLRSTLGAHGDPMIKDPHFGNRRDHDDKAAARIELRPSVEGGPPPRG